MEKRKVSWTKKGAVAIVTIDDPPVNALSQQVEEELMICLKEIEEDRLVRVLVITGSKKIFMAGADIKEFPQLMQGPPGSVADFANRLHYMLNTLDNFLKPTIAAIEGVALGGGLELALACDLRICSSNSKLGLPEINLGLFPGGGGTQRLPRLIGKAKAKEIIFLGEALRAQEALNLGLVNRVAPEGKALEVAIEIANKIANKPNVAIKLIKQSINRGVEVPLKEGLKIEADLFDRVFQTNDVKEGVSAFIEKRNPSFVHN